MARVDQPNQPNERTCRSIHSAPDHRLSLPNVQADLRLKIEVAPSVKPVRILMYDVPDIMSGIVKGILPVEPVCEIVECKADQVSLEAGVTEETPDMVIVINEAHDNAPSRFERLLISKPTMRVLAITPHQGMAFVHWLQPYVEDISPLSSAAMRTALLQVQGRLGMEA